MSRAHPLILVVDDDPDITQNLADILHDLGYQVHTANDGRAALRLVEAHPFDVALLDLKMPGMDGLTLYREIKKRRAGTVGMIVTAFASHATAVEALAAGAWKVIAKPVEFPKLLALVEEAIGRPLILIVDDDRDLCDNLWDLLHERGFRVSLAFDEPEAAAKLHVKTFDVVLIDMRLPNGDGRAVFRAVREANPRARTVVITGAGAELEPVIHRVLAEGADAVCYKPFHIPELLDALDRLVGRRGPD